MSNNSLNMKLYKCKPLGKTNKKNFPMIYRNPFMWKSFILSQPGVLNVVEADVDVMSEWPLLETALEAVRAVWVNLRSVLPPTLGGRRLGEN